MPCTQVLQYALPSSTPTAAAEQSSQGGASDFLLQVLDAALPQQLLLHLQQVFAPAAPFWREHSYGRVGYFSYFFRLVSVFGAAMIALPAAILVTEALAAFRDSSAAHYYTELLMHGLSLIFFFRHRQSIAALTHL